MRLLLAGLALFASPAPAQVRAVPDQPASASAARAGVDVFLINDSDRTVPAEAPPRIEITAADASRVALVPAEQPPATIAPHGFARVRYLSAGVVAVAQPPVVPPPTFVSEWPRAPTATIDAPEQSTDTASGRASAFWDRISPWEPIYGVTGTGSTATKLQFSFAIRPIGGEGALHYFTFAYTQTMFWATDLPSGPFRATTYSPEVFFDVPLGGDARAAFGYRHDSNGRDGIRSIDVNRLFFRVGKGFELGDGWRAEVSPQVWYYVGRRETPGDLDRYWGYTGFKASILEENGLKLALTTRGSFASRRVTGELYASYPVTRLGPDVGVYLFGQGFVGYGEALDDFRRRENHARLGISITR